MRSGSRNFAEFLPLCDMAIVKNLWDQLPWRRFVSSSVSSLISHRRKVSYQFLATSINVRKAWLSKIAYFYLRAVGRKVLWSSACVCLCALPARRFVSRSDTAVYILSVSSRRFRPGSRQNKAVSEVEKHRIVCWNLWCRLTAHWSTGPSIQFQRNNTTQLCSFVLFCAVSRKQCMIRVNVDRCNRTCHVSDRHRFSCSKKRPQCPAPPPYHRKFTAPNQQAVREAATICTRPLQVDLWPLDLESGVQVSCDVGYLCANFSLPRSLCSRF